jgi:hypothetical protein
MTSAALGHSVTALIEVSADKAFAFMKDPLLLGRWSLGCMDTEPSEVEGVYTGTSLFDGGTGFFEIDADEKRLIVDYRLGDLEQRQPRISARIISSEVCGLEEGTCYLTLDAWRSAGMDEARWERLCRAHEAEILLIKSQCERHFA